MQIFGLTSKKYYRGHHKYLTYEAHSKNNQVFFPRNTSLNKLGYSKNWAANGQFLWAQIQVLLTKIIKVIKLAYFGYLK